MLERKHGESVKWGSDSPKSLASDGVNLQDLIEARRPSANADPVWQAGYARFTDHRLWLFHKGTEVLSAPLIQFNTGREDVKHRYRLFNDRDISADGSDAPDDKDNASAKRQN